MPLCFSRFKTKFGIFYRSWSKIFLIRGVFFGYSTFWLLDSLWFNRPHRFPKFCSTFFWSWWFISGVNSEFPFVGILFIAVGFLFKLTAAPFHFWAPDVYEGAPTSVSFLFNYPEISNYGCLFAFVPCSPC